MINFKDFKKISEDPKQVHMKHKDGHTIIIAVKSLPKIHQEALKRIPLSEGGELKGVNKSYYDDGQGGESTAGALARNIDLGKGRKENAAKEHHKVLGEMKAMPNPKLKGMAEGGMAHYDEGTIQRPVSQDDVDSPDAPPAPDAPQAPIDAAPPVPSATPMTTQMTSSKGDGDQQVNSAVDQYGNELNSIQAQNQANRAMIDKAHEGFAAFNADPKSQIDADQYRKNMTLPDKVSTGIGLFLGGFSVPFGGQNFAQDFLNKQIDRNVEAQKENYQHQKNVWGAAHELFGDQHVADNFAKTAALDQVNNMITKSLTSGNNPSAAPRAAKLINDNNNKKEALKNQSAQILTAKQQQIAQQQKPKTLLEKISQYLPTGGPQSAEAGTTAPTQSNNGQGKTGLDTSVPETDPAPQFQINEAGIRRSQNLGKRPGAAIPNAIDPGESGTANSELAMAKSANAKINLIHQNFAQLWQNRGDSNAALKYLSGLGANVGGAHLSLPDLSSLTPQARNYYRAASTIENELASLMGPGGLTEQQADNIRKRFMREGDTPEDYKSVLKSIDDTLLSHPSMQFPTLEQRGLIKRPRGAGSR